MNKKIIVIDRGTIDNAYRLATFTNILIGKNFKHLVFLDNKLNNTKTIYERFKISNFTTSFSKKILVLNPLIFSKSIYWTIKGIFIYLINPLNFIDNFEISKIKVGDLIYDNSIRRDQRFLKPYLDIKFIKILFISVFKFSHIYKVLKNQNNDYICLISSVSHATDSNFALRISLNFGKKVYLHNYAALRVYDKIEQGFLSDKKVYLKDLNKFKISKNRIQKFLKNRFKGSTSGTFTNPFEIKKVYTKKKSFLNRDHIFKILKLKKTKRIVLFSAHAFSDAPHGGATGSAFIFKDYFDLFKKTLKFISENDDGNTLWIFKEHPSSHIFKEVGIFKEYVDRYKFKNLKQFPKEFDLSTLFPYLDTVITGRGTMAIEAATFGIKPIICGVTSFSGLGFTQEPKNQVEYFKNITNMNFNNKLNPKLQSRAQKTLYILENFTSKGASKGKILINKIDKAIKNDEKNYEIKLKKIPIKKIMIDNYYLSVKEFIRKNFEV